MFRRLTITAYRNELFITAAFACLLATGTVSLADAALKTSHPGTVFSELLPDVPGKRLTVIKLNFKPKSGKPEQASSSTPYLGHRHPGSVYVYVTEGTVRFGIEGEPVQTLKVGDSFFEPPGVLHTVAENAGSTEPASAIAVMIMPDGAPVLTMEKKPD